MGTTYRLNLSYEGLEGPPTLIAKLAGEDEEMRAMVAPGYAAEVGFYSRLAPGLNIRTPRCWYGAITDDHTRFTLLLDDMFPATPGIQAEGCTVEQAAASLRTLVGLHIPWLDDPKLRDMEFLMRPNQDTAAMMAQVMSQACETFMERYADYLAPEDGETLRRACTVIERWQLTEALAVLGHTRGLPPRQSSVRSGDGRGDGSRLADRCDRSTPAGCGLLPRHEYAK